jgi:biopolymer transport protein ExbB
MKDILHFIQAGGFVMYPLLVMSFVSIAVIVERCLAYRSLGATSPGLAEEVNRLCRERRYSEALAACAGRGGPVAACLAEVIRSRHLPVEQVERRVEEAGQRYFARMERFLPVLETSTTIAPLLGLLGTILGMVGTFNAIAAARSRQNSDAILAGIGEALYATATGIVVAIVAFVAYNAFTARAQTVTSETEGAVTSLLNVLTEPGLVEVDEADPRALREPAGAGR